LTNLTCKNGLFEKKERENHKRRKRVKKKLVEEKSFGGGRNKTNTPSTGSSWRVNLGGSFLKKKKKKGAKGGPRYTKRPSSLYFGLLVLISKGGVFHSLMGGGEKA